MSDDFVYQPPTEPWLDIVYRDRDLLIVNKPSGLLSVPGRKHRDSALARVQAQEENAYAVHRLDMDTSGLLMIALRRKAERALMEEFRHRRVQKEYIALVDGIVEQEQGVISVPLSRCVGLPPRSIVDWENGKEAHTEYKVLDHQEGFSRIRLFPKTGRSHQLRVHMMHIGHPILGDRFYFSDSKVDRLRLHAQTIEYIHPYHKRLMICRSKSPF